MIAKVKIAPLEHWCNKAKQSARESGVKDFGVGREVEIEVESCRNAPPSDWCPGGRTWRITAKSTEEFCLLNDLFYPEGSTSVMCEHMLEMD